MVLTTIVGLGLFCVLLIGGHPGFLIKGRCWVLMWLVLTTIVGLGLFCVLLAGEPKNMHARRSSFRTLSRLKRESGWPGHPLSNKCATHFHGSCWNLGNCHPGFFIKGKWWVLMWLVLTTIVGLGLFCVLLIGGQALLIRGKCPGSVRADHGNGRGTCCAPTEGAP